MIWWVICLRGRGVWRYIRAEAPCFKGEVQISLTWISLVIGWQRPADTRAATSSS
jgi:hypothetical protein